MSIGAAIIIFFIKIYIIPPAIFIGVFVILYYTFGWKTAFAWVAVAAIGVVSFFSYFRFGFDEDIVRRAIAEKNPSVCHRLLRKPEALPGFDAPIRNPRIECYISYLKTYPSTKECERMPNLDGCITAVATIARDYSVCSVHSGDEAIINCIDSVHENTRAKLTKSFLPECKMFSADPQEECVMLVAVDTKDLALCKTLTDFYRFKGCHETLQDFSSLKGIGENMCSRIEDKGKKEQCYYWFGINAKEPKLCEYIPNEGQLQELRMQCIRDARR